MTEPDTAPSARAYRQHAQSLAAQERRWALVSALSTAIGQHERNKAPERVLHECARLFGAAHGILARQQSGRVEVLASLGVAPPAGTRLPLRGALAATATLPARLLLIESPPSSVWCIGRSLAFEMSVPLVVAGQVVGMMALAAEPGHPPPAQDDLATVTVLGPYLGALLAVPSAARPRLAEKEKALLARLTVRETEVLSLLPRGMTNAGIASALGMAPGTAKVHVERILRKLQLQDRAQAAAKAVEWRIGSSE